MKRFRVLFFVGTLLILIGLFVYVLTDQSELLVWRDACLYIASAGALVDLVAFYFFYPDQQIKED